MNSNKGNLSTKEILRQKAENKLGNKLENMEVPSNYADIVRLLHELQVHQIELEMQNEELLSAKEKAERTEDRYTELYDFSPSGYLTLSKGKEITELNFAAARMLGKERSLLMNRHFDQFILTGEKDAFHRFFEDIFSSNEKQTCEMKLAGKNNRPVYVILSGTVSPCGENCLLSMVEITKRKLAELNLQDMNLRLEESEKRFQQLVNNIDECFWLRDSEQMLYVSPGFEKIWGLPCQAIYDDPQIFTKYIHPDEKKEVLQILESEAFKQSGSFDFDYRIVREDQQTRWVNAKSFPITDNQGNIIRRAGIAIDITEKVEYQQELILAKEHAEQSDRLKSAFLANMSHEIRTPMNGILGFANLLTDPKLTGKKQREFIKMINISGDRMLNIINDIIDISKIESGMMKPVFGVTDINEVLDYIYSFFKSDAEEKGLIFSYKKSLPDHLAVILTDSEKVYAILINLVKNALKYCHKGSIDFGYLQENGSLNFYIKDTGIGIAKDRQQAIFERFVQADIEDRNATQGAGLGLTITKAYVEMLGGKIWVDSLEEVGSTFNFILPYHVVKSTQATANEADIHVVENKLSDLTVLIVEDDEASQLLLEIELMKECKNVLLAKTGVEAVEYCKKIPEIGLVLMDIRMPEMSGYEATRQIRQFNKDLIIIAQTAHGLMGDREKVLKAGCNDYISKPIIINDLWALIYKYGR